MNHPPSKTGLDVLVSEQDLQESFSGPIADVMSGDQAFRLRVHTSTHALQIMALAGRIRFDLFILMLNNIAFPTGNMPPDKRTKQALKFVAQLKARYQKPIIGLYGWPKGAAYGRRAKMAGADSVFGSPPKAEELRAAIVECLAPLLNTRVETDFIGEEEVKGENNGKPSSAQ